MRNRFAALTLVFLAALAPVRAQMVEESLPRDPGPLDLIHGDSYEQWILQSLAGDALVGLGLGGRAVPRLATSWKILKDGAITFTLRADARFTDGSLVTPEDVLWTFAEISRDPKASPTKRAILEGAVARLQDGRLWIRSPKPPGRLLLELARVPIAQKGHPERGSGPFLFQKEPAAWTFLRREHFLKPRIDGIRFRLLPDPATVLQALQKGWLTIGAPPARPLPPPASHHVVVQPMNAQLVVWSHAGLGPLQLLERWRQDAFPPGLLGQNAKPSHGLWPESLGFEPQAIDTEAGPPKPPTLLKLLYASGEAFTENLLLALRERARKDGFELRLIPLEQAILVDRLRRGEFELACSVVVFEPHPWAVLEYMEPNGPMNVTGWRDPQFAALAAKLREPGDGAWLDLQGLWAKHPAALPLLDFQSVIWVDKRLTVEPSPLGLYLGTPGAAGWRWNR
ncbi:ABC transporter substrate-binding protein [Geothrix fuzhouensis]|uniref:ABC transporter substrate-binding protein n=1 Tax=Geothrix fuzhouensis TaxID=2966451 RepID=UPI002148A0F8|nr:ABC transporter substrate-binding protein [Geothrix fuzhouensis]